MDYIIRGITSNGNVRFIFAQSKEIVETAHVNHQTSPLASAALGRLLTAGAMMGRMLKGDSRLTMRIDGNGPLRGIIVDADAEGRVRGFVKNPMADLPLNAQGKLDVGGGLGKGTLTIIKDLGLKENFVSQTALQTGEIGDDLSYYFYISEQIPTAVGVGVLVDLDYSIKQSGGYLIQLLPGASEEDLQAVEKIIESYPSITSLLEQYQIEEIAQLFFGELVEFTKEEISFFCPCDNDRFIRAIATLNQEEIHSMIEEDQGADITCEFCGKHHLLSIDDLQESLRINQSRLQRD